MRRSGDSTVPEIGDRVELVLTAMEHTDSRSGCREAAKAKYPGDPKGRRGIQAVLQEPMEGLQGSPWGALVVSEETHLAMWPRIETRLMPTRWDRALLAQVSLPVLAKNWRARASESNQPQTVRFDGSCREK